MKKYLGYSVYFAVFLAYFYLENKLGIRPFAIAFFMSLVYCKRNILVLSPLYLGAAMIVSPTVPMLIIAGTPIIIILVAVFIHYKLKKPIKMLAVAIYNLLASSPVIFFNLGSTEDIIKAVVGIVGAQIFQYTAIIVMYAILKKRLAFKLSSEEAISFAVVLGSLGMSFYAMQIDWYIFFYTVLGAAVLLSMFVDKRIALVIGIAFGAGGALTSGRAEVMALGVLYGTVVSLFQKEQRYYAGASVLAADVIFRLLFFAEEFSYFSLIAPAAGILVVLVIPRKVLSKLSVFSVCVAERKASRALVNRDRKLVAGKLQTISGVFSEMQDVLHLEVMEKERKDEIDVLTSEITAKCCENCQAYGGCREALGGANTGIIISDLVTAALDNGKATILDTPPFLSSRCKKINGLISLTNDITERYKMGEERKTRFDEGREMLGEQMGGVGTLLNELKKDVEKVVSYDAQKEETILTELSYIGVGAEEAVVYGDSAEKNGLTLILKACYSGNPAITDTVSKVMGIKMEADSAEEIANGRVSVHFSPAPRFRVLYGEREVSLEEGANGDSKKAVKLDKGRVMLILSDGMGAGPEAAKQSSFCLSMLESFYRAGFDYNTIVKSVGRLLALRGKEEFNAVDIAVIDTFKGNCDFIKLGGRESFIVSAAGVEIVECGSLPLGIIDDCVPMIEKRRIPNGGFIVMVSDGIIDVMGREGLQELLGSTDTNNPDELAAAVMEDYLRIVGGKPTDDASVLAARVIEV